MKKKFIKGTEYFFRTNKKWSSYEDNFLLENNDLEMFELVKKLRRKKKSIYARRVFLKKKDKMEKLANAIQLLQRLIVNYKSSKTDENKAKVIAFIQNFEGNGGLMQFHDELNISNSMKMSDLILEGLNL